MNEEHLKELLIDVWHHNLSADEAWEIIESEIRHGSSCGFEYIPVFPTKEEVLE